MSRVMPAPKTIPIAMAKNDRPGLDECLDALGCPGDGLVEADESQRPGDEEQERREGQHVAGGAAGIRASAGETGTITSAPTNPDSAVSANCCRRAGRPW